MYLLRKEPLIKPELINLENLITNPTISFKEFPINNGINTHDDDPIDWGAQNDIVTSSSKEFFEIEDLHFSSEFMLKAHEPNELVYHDEPIDVPKENVKENNNSEIVDLIQFSSEPSIVSKQPNVEFEAISIQSERCGSQNSIEFEPISQPFHIGSTPRRGTYDLSIGRVKSDDMFEPLSSVRSTSDMFEPLSGVSPNETFEAVENPIDFGLTCDFEPIEDDDDSEEDKKQLKPTSLSEILQFCDKGKELVSFF
ncbi:hypothetical protein GPJ56_009495 [Histomonas meleagridis]|uniref:uncharacterized protein n=1 Tax=Histomonas meleagridis TaxID=135588 RepID=UPI00355AC8AB|nr:hypothetical protein GPJ56_009495 [Histomonas meleagridis]KAH0804636.1 hypothetical protein GO595_002572 [Histomonas meleagridis]